MKWVDLYTSESVKKHSWRAVAIFMSVTVCVLSGVVSWQALRQTEAIKKQKIIIMGDQGITTVEKSASVSNGYLKSFHEDVVYLMEGWTYRSLKSNMHRLFTFNFTKAVQNLIEANLLASQRYKFVNKNKMISTFKIFAKKSEHNWCAHIKKACSLILGKRETFVNNNEPYDEKTVGYLIFSKPVYPNPMQDRWALRVTRLLINDSDKNPEITLKRMYKKALYASTDHS